MDSLPLKRCAGCKVEQPLENYHKDRAQKDGVVCRCKKCMAEKNRLDPEKAQAISRAYRAANPEKVRATNKAYRVANSGKMREYSKAWVKANPEKVKAQQKAYRAANPEKIKVRKKAWRTANLDKDRAAQHQRRARVFSAEGSYTIAEWEAKLVLYKGRCHWCGKKIKGVTHADHVIPLARGGTNYISNLVPSCAPCNLSKHARLPHEFMGRLF